jgi:ankyrin repeat protein
MLKSKRLGIFAIVAVIVLILLSIFVPVTIYLISGHKAGSADQLIMALRHKNFDRALQIISDEAIDIERLKSIDMRFLHMASESGMPELVTKLVNLGADVNALDPASETPLFNAVKSKNLEVVRILADKGATINTLSLDGKTPLHHACICENIPILQFLISKGANPNGLATNDSERPIHSAIRQRNTEILHILLSSGADPNIFDAEGDTPLILACASGEAHMILYLLGNNRTQIDLSNRTDLTRTPQQVARQRGLVPIYVNVDDLNGLDNPIDVAIEGFISQLQQIEAIHPDMQCPICLCNFNTESPSEPIYPSLCTLLDGQCHSYFHRECLHEYINQNLHGLTCPTCRKPINVLIILRANSRY